MWNQVKQLYNVWQQQFPIVPWLGREGTIPEQKRKDVQKVKMHLLKIVS